MKIKASTGESDLATVYIALWLPHGEEHGH